MQEKNKHINSELVSRVRGERGGEKITEQIEEYQVSNG